MRYEDASQAGSMTSDVTARDDSEHLAGNDFGPATGNIITGAGTVSGATGTDMAGSGGHITAIAGAGGSDDTFDASGKLEIAGQYGTLTIDAEGNYTYVRNPGSPDSVTDTFTYTLADAAGATDSAKLVINIGDLPMLQAQGTQTIQTNNGVVVLPAGVELSDVHVVGRNLVVTLPDGSTMVIPDGAIFVPQLVLNGVEVPASNLAALLIGSEPTPAAGDLTPNQQSSGGNFGLPPGPLDPGVPLGDLLPPTELTYTPPEFHEPGIVVEDEEPIAGIVSIQLDDDVIPGKSGNPDGVLDDDPDTVGANVVSGFLPGSGGDGSLEWALLETGTPADFTYDVQPDGTLIVTQVQDGNPVVVLTIEVDSATGAFEVTQNNPIRHASGGDENNTPFVINYTVTDSNGDVAGGQLNIDVDDDTPVVSVSATDDSQVVLITDDAQTEGPASDFDSTTANFDGVFSGSTSSAGADGAGSGSTTGYALNVTSAASGLKSHGADINLYKLADGTVVGSTAGTAPATATDASVVFSVAVNASGEVTLTQYQQIDHAPETPSDAIFNDQFTSMADGLVTLTRSVTIVDKDGDPATGSATVNIGQNLHFTDDGPALDGARAGSSVVLDETNGAEPVSAGAPIVVTSDDAMIVPVGADYGADGQGPDPVYGLSLLGGGAVGSSIASGLATADGDHPITLTLTSSTLITATYVDGTGTHTAFTIAMNTNGTVTVTQNTALEHLVDGSTPAAYDDSLSLVTVVNEQTQSLVNATVTIQDFDGDTASASAPIGASITFKDDGPSIDVVAGADGEILLVTGDDGTESTGFTTDSTDADFSGAFSIGSSSGGGDGTASISDISYSLTTAGGDSGLNSHGNDINLYMVGTTVVGAIGSQPADLNDADIVFTVSVNGDGVVTLTQFQQIDHPAVDDPDGTDAPFNDDTISMLNDSLIQLHASATITDNDGDTATDSAAVINIASNLVFQDDGPTIDASLKVGAAVHVDESLPGTDGAGETDAVGLGQATVAISSIVTVTENPISADQPTTIAYSLTLGAAVGGLVDSGMLTSDGNEHVYLYKQLDGSVIGSTATSAGDVDGSNTVFTVALSGGNVVLTQYQAIEHPTGGSSFDEDTSGLAANALQLTATGTDFDGDTSADSVDLGSVITFGDDGPSVDVIEGQIPTNPDTLAAFQLTTQDHGTEFGAGFTADATTINFSGLFSMNKDGGSDGEASSSLTYDLNLLGAGDGPVDSGLDSHGNTIWLYQLDANTIIGSTSATAVALGDPSIVFQLVTTDAGAVTQTQFQQIDHVTVDPTATAAPFDDHIVALGTGLINVVATGTITDNDNDVDTDTETLDLGGLVRFQDDGPTADNEGNIATVDDGATALNIGNVSTLLDGDNYHADGPAAVGAITIAMGDQGGTITIDGSGNLLYTAAADASGGNVVEHFTYTIKDFDGDTASGTFSVTLTDSGAVVGTTAFSVDEEGLAGGIAGTVYVDNSDLAGEVTSVSGNLTGLDFGSDGAGDIVLTGSADTGLRTIANQVVKSSWDQASHTLTGFVDLDANGLDAGDITVFTMQIDDVATGHYQFNLLQPIKHADANTEDNKLLSIEVTVTDNETDGSTGTINITIDDDSPQVSNVLGGASVTLDETTAVTPAGFPISASSATAVITADKAYGADGAAATGATVYGLSLSNGATPGTTIASGLATAVGDLPITLTLVDSTHITGTYNGGANTAFTITMNSDGTITVQQNVALEHLVDGSSAAAHDDSLDLVIDGVGGTNLINATITIKDGDGDTHSGSTGIGDQIIFKDDGPTIDVTATNEASILLTTQDAQTIGTDTDSDATTANFSSVFDRTFTTGADGAATPSISYDLSVLAVDSGLKSHNVTINLYELANGVIVGSTALSAPTLETDSSVVFSVAVATDGTVTLKQYQQVDHTVEGTTTSPFDDQFAILANGKIQLSGSATITDNDGDTATDTANIDLGGNIRFADDGPDVGLALTGTQLRIDETDGVVAVGGEFDPVGGNLGTVTLTAATLFNLTNPHASADAPTTYAYSLVLGTADINGRVDSGLDQSTTDASIYLYNVGGTIVGSTALSAPATVNDASVVFTVSINASGDVTLTQLQGIEHPTAPSSYDEDSLALAVNALQVKVVATDFDGDTDSAQVDLGSVIRFEDDGPALSFGSANPVTSKTATGSMTLNVGSDTWLPSTLVDTIINVTANGGTVGTTPVALTNFTVNPVPTSNTTALVTYSFSFSYDSDPVAAGVQAANGTGSITINKGAGTYSVTLDQSIGYSSTIQTQDLPDSAFHTYNDVDFNNFSQEEVTVAQLTPNFFVQFSGQHNGFDYTGGANGTFSGTPSYVSASQDSNGVASDTIAQNDVLNLNFFNVDPGGDTTNPQNNAGVDNSFAEGFFLEIDHFGGEDMVFVLKLADPSNPNTIITRTFIADASDFYTIDNAPVPGYNFTFDQDDAVLIVEANDYRIAGDPANLSIVGIQLVSSTQGESGSGLNFNGTVGAGGGLASTTTTAFTAVGANDTDDNDVFKIVNIGFKLTTSTPEPITFNFNVTAQDSDGDITANVPIGVTFPASVMPVAMDLDGDGVEFIDSSAGAVYAYDGVHSVATSWVGPDDGILVRDANHNGLVDNSSEFVFGSNGVTDLQALHAQYGAQLDASDADFTMFAVWNDANSNGVVDGNELQSLAEAGITSIGLVSDGEGYMAANGEVAVAGTATFTRADGSTGDVADAAFSLGAIKVNQEVERVAANSNTVALAAAVAAAGVAASPTAAAAETLDFGQHAFATNAVVGKEAFVSLGGEGTHVGGFANLSMLHDGGFDFGMMPMASSSHTAIATMSIGDLTAGMAIGNAPTALLDATDFGGMLQMPAMTNAMNVAMPSIAALNAVADGVQTTGAVEQIIADALHGGGAATDINTLLNALPGAGLGENAGLHQLASPVGNDVPTWDAGHAGVFTTDLANFMTNAPMVLHHDAVQPVANG